MFHVLYTSRVHEVVVEWLTFEVGQSERQAWLDVEESVWSRFLETCDGFIKKQMWMEEGDPSSVHAVIWWRDRSSWKAVSDQQVLLIDAAMGEHWKPCTMRVFEVVRDS